MQGNTTTSFQTGLNFFLEYPGFTTRDNSKQDWKVHSVDFHGMVPSPRR